MSSNYKTTHPDFGKWFKYAIYYCSEKRKAESDKIKERYPDRIPVICEKSETSKLPDIDKTK